MTDKIYLRDIPFGAKDKVLKIIDTWFYEGNFRYFLLSHPMAGEAIKVIESHMTPSEKALKALIKLVVELEDTVTSYHVEDETLKYAHEALKANGGEVYLDGLTRAHYRRLDA